MTQHLFALVASCLLAAACGTQDATPTAPGQPGGACTCSPVGGAYVTDLACACANTHCVGSADSATQLCGAWFAQSITETTYTGCDLRRVEYPGEVEMFDSTGALVGFRSESDVPWNCPGTSTPIGLTLAAGTYEPPASCTNPVTRAVCPQADGGTDAAHD